MMRCTKLGNSITYCDVEPTGKTFWAVGLWWTVQVVLPYWFHPQPWVRPQKRIGWLADICSCSAATMHTWLTMYTGQTNRAGISLTYQGYSSHILNRMQYIHRLYLHLWNLKIKYWLLYKWINKSVTWVVQFN